MSSPTPQDQESFDRFKDDTSKQSSEESSSFDWKFAGIAFGAMILIFGVIIGVLVGKNGKIPDDPPATTAPAVSTAGNATSVNLNCTTSTMSFLTNNSLVLTLSVASDISALEINYAANVFEKTYAALLENELAAATADYCDPYCRKITDVVVTSNKIMTGSTEAQARQAAPTCGSTLELTFGVEGTYHGCEDTAFPGLFSPTATTDGERMLLRNRVVSAKTPFFHRHLDDDNDSCPVCPDDVQSLGLVSPSTEQLKDVMKDYVTVLPAICELTTAEIVANDDASP